ncbi:hypothetical protein ACFIQF_15220 [Comamonas sp. J-3]|jgi:hypothetical protein
MKTPDVKKRPGHEAKGADMRDKLQIEIDAASVQREPVSHPVKDILLKIIYLWDR